MHELAVCQSIIRSLEDEYGPEQLVNIREVHLKIGVLAGVVPAFIGQVYPYLTEGTLLEESRLCCELVDVLAQCSDCGQTFRAVNQVFICPTCGIRSSQVVEGRELLIHKIVSIE
jgi:hydrogenase nickel incorporation protein HypA/HybF